MLSSKIKYCDVEFGKCNKDLLEEVISYGISLGADFVEIFLEKSSTKLIENKGDTTSPKTTNPPAINKTISINSKSKDLISCQPNFFKDIVFHYIFKARIEPISIVKSGIILMANILKNIFLENDFVINALSSKSNFLLKRWYKNLSSLNKSNLSEFALYELLFDFFSISAIRNLKFLSLKSLDIFL